MKQWVNLHQHTTYSFLDGHADPYKLMERAKEIGMPAIASTDHGNIHGWLHFYEAAQEIGINLRTAHNQIGKGVFPIPTVLRDRRRYVHITDLASYLDRLRQRMTEKNPLSKRVARTNGRAEKLGSQTNHT